VRRPGSPWGVHVKRPRNLGRKKKTGHRSGLNSPGVPPTPNMQKTGKIGEHDVLGDLCEREHPGRGGGGGRET